MHNRRFAVGDIHGCLDTLKTLLFAKINLTKSDKLYLLGDYVHRGPSSEGVLNFIMRLQKEGYNVFPIMGNHELMYKDEMGKSLDERHLAFIDSLPYYREENDFYFVHAELNFAAEDPLAEKYTMVWGNYMRVQPDMEFLAGRKVVHGHVIHSLSDIFDAVYEKAPIIPLDNGCYKALHPDFNSERTGNLCALDLDKMQLIVQTCVDELA